jgi:hypothetical protein
MILMRAAHSLHLGIRSANLLASNLEQRCNEWLRSSLVPKLGADVKFRVTQHLGDQCLCTLSVEGETAFALGLHFIPRGKHEAGEAALLGATSAPAV